MDLLLVIRLTSCQHYLKHASTEEGGRLTECVVAKEGKGKGRKHKSNIWGRSRPINIFFLASIPVPDIDDMHSTSPSSERDRIHCVMTIMIYRV